MPAAGEVIMATPWRVFGADGITDELAYFQSNISSALLSLHFMNEQFFQQMIFRQQVHTFIIVS
jgi:hypothetical protein